MPKSPSKKATPKKTVKSKEPDVMVAMVHDGATEVDILMNVVRGKVESVVFPLDKGDRLTVSASLLRSTVEMIDGTDADNG